ncbi:LLM class flavin-dependent oxidoreductase [Streptomyces montanisoli]|uniref:LLM class flavin-dependent oxidoreductase n=1 Tax=Streptomyces montanisoli TaxID=2798581 RepID=A0A940M922_9ACTN|nr:LLM class flavin-dependent oxidoreductase [Streptomyces montanisoli]MBP0456598.1 LLM class flavin-dependent oxidoreductase [Streptomyces montanisoli]
MRHGISLLPDCRPAARSAREYYRDALTLSRTAEELGLDYVKMTEHYLRDYGGYCPDPLGFLSAVAGCTSSIRLMTGAIQASFHHPLQIAAQAAMVDAISGGRLDVGFARAWLPYEFEAFGVPMDESRARFQATVNAVRRLWTEESVDEETPFFRFRRATSLPRPEQRPHPPVWVAAVRSRQSFTWIAEQGFGLLVTPPPHQDALPGTREMVEVYLETFRAVHGPGASPRVAVSVPLFVAETDEEAYRVADPLLREYLTVWAESAEDWSGTTSKDYPTYEAMGRILRTMRIDDFRSVGTAVVGSPEQAVERARQLTTQLHADTMLWQVDFGGQTMATMEPNLRLFASQVMPKLG